MSLRRFLSRKSRTNKSPSNTPQARANCRPILEMLEPRLLLSADLAYATLPGGTTDLESEPLNTADTPAILASVSDADEQAVVATLQDEPSNVTPAYRIPQLPGLESVDWSSIDQIAGQVFYLDFDGAEDVVYDGPMIVGPFDVPAFEAPGELGGQEQVIIDQILLNLQDTFTGSGVIFTTDLPLSGTEYSTIYVGGDDSAFSAYGSFLGLAEQVDVGNLDCQDEGLVFSDQILQGRIGLDVCASLLVGTIAHEAGHLVGYNHPWVGGGRLSRVAATSVTGSATERAMWVWSDSDNIINTVGTARKDLFDFCKAPHGDDSAPISTIYFCAGKAITNNQSALRDFLREADDEGLKVQYLAGDPAWATEEGIEVALEYVRNVIDFNKGGEREEQFSGIHFDIEPQEHEDWPEKSGEIWTHYIDLLGQSRSIIDYYNEHNDPNQKDLLFADDISEDYTEDQYSDILDIVDYVVIMAYSDNAGTIVEKVQDEIQYGSVWIAVETQDIARVDRTFYDEGVKYMEGELKEVVERFQDIENFLGIAIHHYYSYRYLISDPELFPEIVDGRLAWHSYTAYDYDETGYRPLDSQIHVYDFPTHTHYQRAEQAIAARVQHAMNPKFSANGRYLTFMGLPRTREYSHTEDGWASFLDIFMYDFLTNEVVNISEKIGRSDAGEIDEDPVFSPDGQWLAFKYDRSDIYAVNIFPCADPDYHLRQVTAGTGQESGPQYSPDGKWIVFWVGEVEDAYIAKVPADSREATQYITVVDNEGIQDYFPAFWDNNRLIYTSWDESDRDDDIHILDGADRSAAFNRADPVDDSDAFRITDTLIGFSRRSAEYPYYVLSYGDPLISMPRSFNIDQSGGRHNLGGSYSEIVLREVMWLDTDGRPVSEVMNGQRVLVRVYGTPGQKVRVEIYEDDLLEGDEQVAAIDVVIGAAGSGEAIWQAEWRKDVLGNPEFYARILDTGVESTTLDVHQYIQVPFYNQSDSQWCWAFATSIMLGAYGFDRRPWEIAADLNHDYYELGSSREVHNYLEDYYDWDSWNAWELNGWNWWNEGIRDTITSTLDQGKPLWLGSYDNKHAMTMIGYTGKGDDDLVYYVDSLRDEVIERSWEQFFDWLDTHWSLLGDADMIYANGDHQAVFDGVASISVLPGSYLLFSNDIGGEHQTLGLYWDGTAPHPGYMYEGYDWYPDDAVLGKKATTADVLTISPYVFNNEWDPNDLRVVAQVEDVTSGLAVAGAKSLSPLRTFSGHSGGSELDWVPDISLSTLPGAGEYELWLYVQDSDDGGATWTTVDSISYRFNVEAPPGGEQAISVAQYRAWAPEDAETQRDEWEEGLWEEYPTAFSIQIISTSTSYGPFVVTGVSADTVNVRQEVTVSYRATIRFIAYDADGNAYEDEATESATFTGVATGQPAQRVIEGTDIADVIILNGVIPAFTIYGRGGNDVIDLGNDTTGAAVIYGGSGDDTIYGGRGADEIYGGADNDWLIGNGGDDVIDGGDGFDVILGDSGVIRSGGQDYDDHPDVVLYGTYAGADTIHGGGDRDWIYGQGGNDTICGDGDNDYLYGGEESDTIYGGPGNDWIYGQDGNDILIGDDGRVDDTEVVAYARESDGVDYIYGEAGEDKILGGGDGDHLYGDYSQGSSVSGSPGRDIIVGDSGKISYSGDTFGFNAVTRVETLDEDKGGIDYIYGNELSSVLVGGSAGDFIYGHDEPDTILGDNGVVELSDGQLKNVNTTGEALGGLDYIEGHDGNDVIVGGANGSSDTIYGHEGDDVILGDNGVVDFSLDGDLSTLDLVESADDGIGGSDVLYGNAGKDIVIGGPGDDRVYGDGDPDLLIGDEGRVDEGQVVAYVRTSDGADVIYGEAGEDKILGGGGDDHLYGDSNPDGTASSSPGREIIIGDGGRITHTPGGRFAFGTTTYIETIDEASGGADHIYGNELSSILFGGTGGDFIYGHISPDMIVGDNGFADFGVPGVLVELSSSDPQFAGADEIDAGNGPDVVIGGSGDDTIVAGGTDHEKDTVLGDNGRVTFGGNETFDPGEEYSILSFNFNADEAQVTGVAGAPGVEAGNWNNLGGGQDVYGDESGEVVRFDDGRIAPGVVIDWGVEPRSPHPYGVWLEDHSQIEPGDDQNRRLFEGYLLVTAEEVLGIDISGLAGHFESFDVYVYIDADDYQSDAVRSVRCISDGTTEYYQDDIDGNNFAGAYVQVSSTDPLSPSVGNYVVFAGLTGDGASIRIESDMTLLDSWLNRPSIAGIQIVGRHYAVDRVETLDPEHGGNDVISTGGGPDLVMGGSGDDAIETGSNPVYGRVDADIIAGDNARATFMLGEMREIYTTDPEHAGSDTIRTGNGEDLVLGGNEGDVIDTGVSGDYENGEIQVISFNFTGCAGEDLVTDVAGAVQVGNWNNLLGGGPAVFGDTPDEQILLNDGSVAEGVTIQWGRRLDGAVPLETWVDSHDQIVNPGTENEHLFKGYVYANPWDTLGVNLAGLDVFDTPYDLYVYVDGNDSGSVWCDPLITDGTTTFYVNDPDGNTFQGEFVRVDSTSLAGAEVGNYVVFRDLTSNVVELRVTGVGSAGGFPVITAIQIVGGQDRNAVVIGGDYERDAVVGDSGAAYLFGGQLWELTSTEPEEGGDDTIRTGADTDLVIGGAGSDTIDGQTGHDVVLGDNGVFTLFEGEVIGLDFGRFSSEWDGSVRPYEIAGITLLEDSVGGGDILAGGRGDDLLYGQFGDDTFVFAGQGLGRDGLVEAGDDDAAGRPNDAHDVLDFSAFESGVKLDLREESQQVVSGEVVHGDINLALILFSGTAFEDVICSEFDDVVDGNARDNTFDGRAGDDVLRARDGSDWVSGGSGDDSILAGSGNDHVYGDADSDSLWGAAGDDVMHGGPGNDRIYGEEGDDFAYGEEGEDVISGGVGNDYLVGGSENDEIYGNDGNDEIYGDAGEDRLFGGKDDDIVEGGDGNDYLHGDDDNMWFSNYGHDRLAGGAGDDVIQGGGGRNTLYFPGATEPVHVELDESGHGTAYDGLGGTDTLYNIREVIGTEFGDTMIGGGGPDTFHGMGGNDKIEGRGGDDSLYGDAGDDWLDGGEGYDEIYGGEGSDTIISGEKTSQSVVGTGAVYRFWSPVNLRHFYTISEAERDKLIENYSHVWTYEGIAYYAFLDDSALGVSPVHRFWSAELRSHFYTVSEAERVKLTENYADVWTYEGVAFYAYPGSRQVAGMNAVYRFWSPRLRSHFYTINQREKDKLIDFYPDAWTYENIAWYAFEM